MSDDSEASLPLPSSPREAPPSVEQRSPRDSDSDDQPLRKIQRRMSVDEENPPAPLPLDDIPYPDADGKVQSDVGETKDVEIPLPPDSSNSKYSPSQVTAGDASPVVVVDTSSQQKKTVTVLGRAQAKKRLQAFSATKLAASSTTGGVNSKKSPVKGVSVFSGRSSDSSKQPTLAIASIKEEETKMKEILAMNSILSEKLKTVHAITTNVPALPPATAIVKPLHMSESRRNFGSESNDNNSRQGGTGSSKRNSSEGVFRERKEFELSLRKPTKNIRKKHNSSSNSSRSSSRSPSKSPGRKQVERRSKSREREIGKSRMDRGARDRDRDRNRGRERDRSRDRDVRLAPKGGRRSRSRDRGLDTNRGARRSRSPKPKDKYKRKSRSRSRDRRKRSRDRSRDRSSIINVEIEKPKLREKDKLLLRSPPSRIKNSSPSPANEKNLPRRISSSRSPSLVKRRPSRSRSTSPELKPPSSSSESQERISRRKSRSRSREKSSKTERNKSPSNRKSKTKDKERDRREREKEREREMEKKQRELERIEKERLEAIERELNKVRKSRMPTDWTDYKKYDYSEENIHDLWKLILPRGASKLSRNRSDSRSPSPVVGALLGKLNQPYLGNSMIQQPKLIHTVPIETSNIKKDYPEMLIKTTKLKPTVVYGVNPLSYAGYYRSRQEVLETEDADIVQCMLQVMQSESSSVTPHPAKEREWYAEQEQTFCPSEGSKGIVISHLYSDEEVDETPSRVTEFGDIPRKSTSGIEVQSSHSEPMEEDDTCESSPSQDSVPSPLLKRRLEDDDDPPVTSSAKSTPTSSLPGENISKSAFILVKEKGPMPEDESEEDSPTVVKTLKSKKEKKKKKQKDSKKRHRKDSKHIKDSEEDSSDTPVPPADSEESEPDSEEVELRKKQKKKKSKKEMDVEVISKSLKSTSKEDKKRAVAVSDIKKVSKKSKTKDKHRSESDASDELPSKSSASESSDTDSDSEIEKRKKKKKHRKKKSKDKPKRKRDDSSDDDRNDRGRKSGGGSGSSRRRNDSKGHRDGDRDNDRRKSKDEDGTKGDRKKSSKHRKHAVGEEFHVEESSDADSSSDNCESSTTSSSSSSSSSNSVDPANFLNEIKQDIEDVLQLQGALEDVTDNEALSKLLKSIDVAIPEVAMADKYDPFKDEDDSKSDVTIQEEHVNRIPVTITSRYYDSPVRSTNYTGEQDLLKITEGDDLLQMVMSHNDISAESILASIGISTVGDIAELDELIAAANTPPEVKAEMDIFLERSALEEASRPFQNLSCIPVLIPPVPVALTHNRRQALEKSAMRRVSPLRDSVPRRARRSRSRSYSLSPQGRSPISRSSSYSRSRSRSLSPGDRRRRSRFDDDRRYRDHYDRYNDRSRGSHRRSRRETDGYSYSRSRDSRDRYYEDDKDNKFNRYRSRRRDDRFYNQDRYPVEFQSNPFDLVKADKVEPVTYNDIHTPVYNQYMANEVNQHTKYEHKEVLCLPDTSVPPVFTSAHGHVTAPSVTPMVPVVPESDMVESYDMPYLNPNQEVAWRNPSNLKEIRPAQDYSFNSTGFQKDETGNRSPKRLSLDERLEMEMGIKLQDDTAPGFGMFAGYQNHKFPQVPITQGTPTSAQTILGPSFWANSQNQNAPAQVSTGGPPQQSQAILLGDVIQVLPGEMLNRTFTITRENCKLNPLVLQQTALQVVRKDGDTVEPKKCILIKVPVIPFKVPIIKLPDAGVVPEEETPEAKKKKLREDRRAEKKKKHELKKKRMMRKKMERRKLVKKLAADISASRGAEKDHSTILEQHSELTPEINQETEKLESASSDQVSLKKPEANGDPLNISADIEYSPIDKTEPQGTNPDSQDSTEATIEGNGPQLVQKLSNEIDSERQAQDEEPMNYEQEREDQDMSSPPQPPYEHEPLPLHMLESSAMPKGILVIAGFRRGGNSSKGVKFVDGVLPGYGSCKSEAEEIHSPPPVPKNKALTKKKEKKKKVKSAVDEERKKKLKQIQESEYINSQEPPPPPKTPYPYCPLGLLYQFNPPYAVLYAQAVVEHGFEVTFTPSMEDPKAVFYNWNPTITNMTHQISSFPDPGS